MGLLCWDCKHQNHPTCGSGATECNRPSRKLRGRNCSEQEAIDRLATLQEKPALGKGRQPIPPWKTWPQDGDLPQSSWPRVPYATICVWFWFSFRFREPALLKELLKKKKKTYWLEMQREVGAWWCILERKPKYGADPFSKKVLENEERLSGAG